MNQLATPHITTNSFLTFTGTSCTADEPESILLYFIPGNPGLIAYYHTFLSLLSSTLISSAEYSDYDDGSAENNSSTASSSRMGKVPQYIIHGKSMGGFEIVENGKHVSCCSPPLTNIKANGGMETQSQSQPQAHHHPTTKTNKLYSLSEQIEHVERNLNNFVDAWHARKLAQTRGKDLSDDQGRWRHFGGVKVILIGHSVGAYIAMEILRRHREGIRQNGAFADTGVAGIGATMDIVGGILLFPTVVDIAQSSSGRKLTKLLYVPYLAFLTSLLVKFLIFILPGSWLRSIVGRVMGSPSDNAIDTTVAFLKSARGVEQAIHMSADEMRDITYDKWSDEIWGIASSSSAPSPMSAPSSEESPLNLVLYFAKQDHWVADRTRDEIIRVRGGVGSSSGSNGPRMQVCEDGVVHGFCIQHSDIMAKKTAGWVRDIVQRQQNLPNVHHRHVGR
ncbi:esterase/lipase superfamily domain-containing protein [Histoplasma capsulatum var. duboisii H88]|uniref:Esterase/lipase superfamily domain-containing protein n=1 Tax=Ajellomyces capsulatus (strain H88) TaxID=544711 RepID=A0A8A1LTD4_AJEC8|nr:esterase/lipase superfamily domain-containing protein [Histoplasma capsulatum var. duboisii H88]